jgi:hypothetical protein
MRSRRCIVRIGITCSWLLTLNIFSAGHYLNLPVVEDDGRLVAIVDVLKLTYATLEQVKVFLYRLQTLVDTAIFR